MFPTNLSFRESGRLQGRLAWTRNSSDSCARVSAVRPGKTADGFFGKCFAIYVSPAIESWTFSIYGHSNRYDGYFVDLFVRVSNSLAINMYEKFGYTVYRRVLGYYSGEEDAFGK
jgi:hypothetical protein